MLRVAVVGSGPSGCYTAQSLVQQDPEVRVDVLDRLPCPYGLVRYGVAPDHEKIKSLQGSLRTVLEHERVRQAMATLPPEQREVVDLAYYGGFTQSEIAQRVGIPLGTVKGRMRLALEKLRDALRVRDAVDEGMERAR